MRPLAVLILILGAVSALIFALTSILDDGGRTPQPVLTGPAEAPEPARTPDGPLAAPERVDTTPADRVEPEPAPKTLAGPRDRAAFGGAIACRVEDAEGQPIPDAEVRLYDHQGGELSRSLRIFNGGENPNPVATATSDEDGRFTFDQLDWTKSWSVVVTHERFMRTEVGPIPVPEDGVREETILLEPGLTCQGYVRDAATGLGVADATLTITSAMAAFLPAERRRETPRLEVTTDSLGYYLFTNVSHEPATLIITAKGYGTQVHNNFSLVSFGEAPVRFKGTQPKAGWEAKEQDFELTEGMTIAGRVYGPDREGIAGVQIDGMSQSGSVGSRGFATSLAGGEFLIEDVSAGTYTLRANAEGYQSTNAMRVEAGDTNVSIVLAEQGGVTGRVIGVAGQPFKSPFTAKVRVMHERTSNYGNVVTQRNFRSPKNGEFTLEGVPEGTYAIEIVSSGYASSFSEPFSVTQGVVTSEVVVQMSKGGTLTGVVLDSYTGEPLAGAEVATQDNNWMDSELFAIFENMSPSALTKAKVYTKKDGRFTIELMTPGQYQLRIKRPEYTSVVLNDVEIIADATIDVGPQQMVKGATIKGIVYGVGRKPQSGALVTMTPLDGSQIWSNRKARSDASGSFEITNAQAGTYKLSASRPRKAQGNPFASVVDMRESEIEVTISDGGTYEFELSFSSL